MPSASPPEWFRPVNDYWTQAFLFWTLIFISLDFIILIVPSWIVLAIFSGHARSDDDPIRSGHVFFLLVGTINLVFVPMPVYLYLLSRLQLVWKMKKAEQQQKKSVEEPWQKGSPHPDGGQAA